jgi:hypothetical protein
MPSIDPRPPINISKPLPLIILNNPIIKFIVPKIVAAPKIIPASLTDAL